MNTVYWILIAAAIIAIVVIIIILARRNNSHKAPSKQGECKDCAEGRSSGFFDFLCPDKSCPTCPTCPSDKTCPVCPPKEICRICPPEKVCPQCPVTPPDQVLNYTNSIIYLAGFQYDYPKGIYESRQDALQRIFGYTSMYDDLSTHVYMVIDIEPIYFTYGNQKYMIELWKGQYGVASGCEIGIYLASDRHEGKYYSATDSDMLPMSYSLYNNKMNQTLFTREGTHWWLTGFKPGVFSNPEDLSLENINIQFKNSDMARAFYNAMVAHFQNRQSEYQYRINNSTVSFRWHNTVAEQPNLDLRAKQQEYNRGLVTDVNRITGGNYTPENINVKVVEFLKFLNIDDNSDLFLDWALGSKNEDLLRSRIMAYDRANGNQDVMNIFLLLKFVFVTYKAQKDTITKGLRLYCDTPFIFSDKPWWCKYF